MRQLLATLESTFMRSCTVLLMVCYNWAVLSCKQVYIVDSSISAAGVNYKMLRRVHMIGELTKGHCSMLGAWGSATPGGSTVQLRAFDWDVNVWFS